MAVRTVCVYRRKAGSYYIVTVFLPRDDRRSAVMSQYVVCLSVCPSVTFRFRYLDHIDWNTSKTISRLISL